jgi:periplasmic divalent cation tolerance protein
MKFCYLYLTCDANQVDEIIDALLQKHLIVCAKKVPTNATYWWKGNNENDDEILLIMESSEEKFESVESELKKIHNYDTFVLTAVPMIRVSKDAKKWMEDNLEKDSQ